MARCKVERTICGHCSAANERPIRFADPAAHVNGDPFDRTGLLDTVRDGGVIRRAVHEAGVRTGCRVT